MATLQIDKLLETVVKENVSDLHITTGQPPVVRLHGRLRRLETKVLEAADTELARSESRRDTARPA